MNKEEVLDKLRKMLFTTQQANECGLSNNDFKEDIQALSGAIGLIEKQDKIIDKMAEQFYNLYRNVEIVRDSFDMPFGKFLKSKEEVIEYFKKEVKKDVKN